MATDYVGIALNGFFTGLGVVAANYLWKEHIEHRAKKISKAVKEVKKSGIDIDIGK